MTMHSGRIKPLHEAAQRNEETAVRRFVDHQRELQRHEAKLAELEAYLTEYSRPSRVPQHGLRVRMQREFVDRLSSAVKLVRQAADQARAACELERTRWLLAHRNAEVLDRLAAQYRAQEARVENRQVQRETDEIAVQIWRRQGPPP